MRHTFVFVLVIALVGCGSATETVQPTTATNDSYDSFVSQDQFCESTGTAICARSNQCGFVADESVDRCLSAYRNGCCGMTSAGVDGCLNGTVLSVRQSRVSECSNSLGSMSCDDLGIMLNAPGTSTVPAECRR